MVRLSQQTLAQLISRVDGFDSIGARLFQTVLLLTFNPEDSTVVQALAERASSKGLLVDEHFLRRCFELLDVTGRLELLGSYAMAQSSSKLFVTLLRQIRPNSLEKKQRTLLSRAVRDAASKHPELEVLRPIAMRYLSSAVPEERANGVLMLAHLNPRWRSTRLVVKYLSSRDRNLRISAWYSMRVALSKKVAVPAKDREALKYASTKRLTDSDSDVRREAGAVLDLLSSNPNTPTPPLAGRRPR